MLRFYEFAEQILFYATLTREKNKPVKHRLLFDKPQSVTFTESHVLPYLYYHKSGFLYSVFTVFYQSANFVCGLLQLPRRRNRTTGTAARSGVLRARRPVRERRTVQPRPVHTPSVRAYPRAPHSACRERGRTARRSASFRQSTRFCFRGSARVSSCTSRLSCPAMCAGVTARTKAMPAARPAMPGTFGVPLSSASGRKSGLAHLLGQTARSSGQQRLRGNPASSASRMPVPIGPYSALCPGMHTAARHG